MFYCLILPEYIRNQKIGKMWYSVAMRIHRFYLHTPISDNTFDISDRELVHQWKHVFRYNVGSQVILFDGSGQEHLSMISRLATLGATVSIVKSKDLAKVSREVCLCMSIIKKDNFELIVQKATELGVSRIIPILSERSEKKNINLERLQKIAIEASEQSGRGDVPTVSEVMTLGDLLEKNSEHKTLADDKIVLHPEGMLLSHYIESTHALSVAVFVGPEGGWSENEIALFKTYDIPIISLGTQILRAETAAIAGLSVLLL